MDHIAKMVDMSLDEQDRKEMGYGSPMVAPSDGPKYPYGLAIRLTQHELEKLGVDHGDWSVGDFFHLHCLAKITSVSESQSENNTHKCVELQITAMAGESEDEENAEEEAQETPEEEAAEQDEEKKPAKRPNFYFDR